MGIPQYHGHTSSPSTYIHTYIWPPDLGSAGAHGHESLEQWQCGDARSLVDVDVVVDVDVPVPVPGSVSADVFREMHVCLSNI